MEAALSHITALEVLRRWESFRHIAARPKVEETCAPASMPSPDVLGMLTGRMPALSGATLPIHVLVSHDAARHASAHVVAHMALPRYPEGSFFSLAPGIVCSSPELVALQMAEYATELELLLLVDELCGYYGVNPHAKSGLVQRSSPLTSVAKIRAYLEKLGPVRGARKLGRALDAARDGSGSPQESRSAHRIEFAPRRGGYGIKVVALNAPLEVERAAALLGEPPSRIRKPDILLLAPDGGRGGRGPFRAVALDYQGEHHRSPRQQARDIARRNELLASNIKDYEIDRDHYNDSNYFDWLISRVRIDLGIPEPRMSKRAAAAWREARAKLCDQLGEIDGLHWTGRRRPLVMAGARDFKGEFVQMRRATPGMPR